MPFRFLLPLLLFAGLAGCTEPNPSYDPLFVPPCEVGTFKCGESPRTLLACLEEDGQDPAWELLKTCWPGTICTGSWCGPGTALPCSLPAECTVAGEVCTAVTDSQDHIGNYCIPAPIPGGREPGRACSRHEDCTSGWCFRRTCYHPCGLTEDCPFSGTCENLNVTVDHTQDTIRGCVIP